MDWSDLGSETWTLIATYGLRIVGVFLVLLMAWLVGNMARRTMIAGFARSGFDLTLGKFFASVVRYAILTFSVLGCLGLFGVETSSFAAVLAAAGLAVGLAFQGTLSNFSAGMMLLVFRPFKVGQFVDIAGTAGTVEEIDLFTTELKTSDNKKIVLPNSSITSAKITNFNAHDTRRVDIAVGVSYVADIDSVRELLERTAASIPGVIDEPAPEVFLSALGASSVDWIVRLWCKTEDYWAVHQAGLRAVKYALDEAGVSIPFPQMDVHVHSVSTKAPRETEARALS